MVVVPGYTGEPGELRMGAAGTATVPTCVTGKLVPASVALAERDVDPFAVQETVTLPLPEPLTGAIVSQEPFPEAVHVPP